MTDRKNDVLAGTTQANSLDYNPDTSAQQVQYERLRQVEQAGGITPIHVNLPYQRTTLVNTKKLKRGK